MTTTILSRKKNESIIIDDDIIITVVEIRGDKVRLGVEAPIEMSLHRGEVYADFPRWQDERRSRLAKTQHLTQHLQREIRGLEGQQETIRQQIKDLQRQVLELQAQLTN